MTHRARQNIDRLASLLDRISWFDWVALLSMIALIRVSHEPIYLAVALLAGVVLLLVPKLRPLPWLWLGIVVLWIPRLVFHWQENEDHVYLVIYWFAAIGLALWGASVRDVLAGCARLLVGASFAFAVAWKLLSPTFCDGSLFHFKLLYDYRFREVVTVPVAGLSSGSATQNVAALRSLRGMDPEPAQRTLAIPKRVSLIAHGMTVWTIVVEALLAVLFLLPSAWSGGWLRHGALLVFIITTYSVVPVMGFACLFAAMGVAQTPPSAGRTRLAYVGVLVLLSALYSIRWLLPSPG